jgi:gluconate 2-dehydrogenase alpha chain
MADVVLIGLGGAGGIAADVLAEAGAEVVALEAGPRVGREDARFDELANNVEARLSAPKAIGEAPRWRMSADRDAERAPWPVLMVNAVGGSTVHYPGLSAPLDPWNFESRSRTIGRYGAGAIPAGSTIADWPLTRAELDPAYRAVERMIGVAGGAGGVPPLRRSGWNELTAAAARRLDWRPFAAPAAIDRGRCTYCGFCSGNVCHADAKGSTDMTAIPRAEASGRLRVISGARVTRVEVDADGLACGARYVLDGREEIAAAPRVLLGAFVYENVRLLLLSTSPAHPRGLANGSGQVGRHFMAHVTPNVFGRFPGRRLNLWSGLWAQATCVEDWNADNFDHSGLGFIGGAMLTAPQELGPIALASAPTPPGVPRWGSGWKAWLRENAPSIAYVNAQVEDLAYEDCLLDLDPDARDPHGLPVIRVTHRAHENELRCARFMVERMREWLEAAGAAETWHAPEPSVEARHCYGGTRMGEDPATSVVDRFGFAHEVPNLGILGASVFPTTGGVNPTLTLQALAWRTATRCSDLDG